MAEVSNGIYSALSISAVYELFSTLVGAGRGRRLLVQDHIRPVAGNRILDIGCGPADIIDYLPEVNYTGIDYNQNYIEKARKLRSRRGVFHVGNIYDLDALADKSFDPILGIGVLHHLENEQAGQLFQFSAQHLVPGGRMITVDPCYEDGQSPIARFIISRDRGQHVRTRGDYCALATALFTSVQSEIRHDLINIPFTHCIIECQNP